MAAASRKLKSKPAPMLRKTTGRGKPSKTIMRTGEEGPKRSTPRVTPSTAMNRGTGVGAGIARRATGTPTTRVSPSRRQENLPKPKNKKKKPPRMGAGVPGFKYGRETK